MRTEKQIMNSADEMLELATERQRAFRESLEKRAAHRRRIGTSYIAIGAWLGLVAAYFVEAPFLALLGAGAGLGMIVYHLINRHAA